MRGQCGWKLNVGSLCDKEGKGRQGKKIVLLRAGVDCRTKQNDMHSQGCRSKPWNQKAGLASKQASVEFSTGALAARWVDLPQALCPSCLLTGTPPCCQTRC